MTALLFSLIFLVALLASTTLRLYLATRQLRHVRAHRDAVPEAFRHAITREEHEKAAAYTAARVRLSVASTLLDATLALGFTLGGGLDWCARLVASLGLSPLAGGVLLVALVTVVSSAASLPLSIASTFGVEARFGFNKTTPALFVQDLAKGALLSALIGLPLVALVLWLMGAMGEWWWLYAWLAWSGFNLLLMVIYPTLIAPLFNRFTPLSDEALKARIEALLARTGFKSRGVYVMDGSRRSSHGNAYFTGFGAARRIVFFDKLLEQLEPAEVEAVLAHELGHFHHKHILRRMVFTFALSLGFLWLLDQLMDAAWFYQGLGVAQPGTAVALLLFFLAVPAFTFPLTPLMSVSSRRHEYQADDFAAREASADALVSALTKLYRDNASTLTPDPLYSAFYDSHPPAALRVAHLKRQQGDQA